MVVSVPFAQSTGYGVMHTHTHPGDTLTKAVLTNYYIAKHIEVLCKTLTLYRYDNTTNIYDLTAVKIYSVTLDNQLYLFLHQVLNLEFMWYLFVCLCICL